MTEPRTIPVATLVEDFDIYPRHEVDSAWVADLARALQAGAVLPPITVEKRTLRIVDGFHRRRAHIKAFGAETAVQIVEQTFKSEAALIEACVAANSAHGRRLDSTDRTRAALMLSKVGVAPTRIAVVLNTTQNHVEQILMRVVVVEGERRPAKRSLWPEKDGTPRIITAEQYTVHQSSSGWDHAQTIRTLIRDIEAGLVDVEAHAELLRQLRAVLDVALEPVPA